MPMPSSGSRRLCTTICDGLGGNMRGMNEPTSVAPRDLRLVDARALDWQDRAHFFAVSARIMRRILVDAARVRRSLKRGGAFQRVDPPSGFDMDALPAPVPERAKELCALDDALELLAEQDPRRAQVIELRFFGGLSVEETAEVLKVSVETVMRDWRLARAWLRRELQRNGA